MGETRGSDLFTGGYGYRARIGMLIPGIVDETISAQFYRMAPEGVTLVKTSLGVREVTVGDISAALERIDAAAAELARREVDCIMVGGSPTAVVGGHGSERRLAERIAAQTGIPTCAAQTAAVEALRTLGLRRLAVATPFSDEFDRLLADFLGRSGFEVACIHNLGVPYVRQTTQPLEAGYRLARRCLDEAPQADGLYVPAAPFPIADVIDRLERETGRTVVTSLQATTWMGLTLAGRPTPVSGYGRLLAEFPAPGAAGAVPAG